MKQWYASMPDEGREAYDAFCARAKADSEARREARLTRQAERRVRDAALIACVLSGLSTQEAASALKMKLRTVQHTLARLGVERAAPGYRRIPSGWIPAMARDQIHRVATDLGKRPIEVVESVVCYAFEDNAYHARRLLRAPTTRREA